MWAYSRPSLQPTATGLEVPGSSGRDRAIAGLMVRCWFCTAVPICIGMLVAARFRTLYDSFHGSFSPITTMFLWSLAMASAGPGVVILSFIPPLVAILAEQILKKWSQFTDDKTIRLFRTAALVCMLAIIVFAVVAMTLPMFTLNDLVK